uniref:CAZy families GH5 protein n=1 Tax=uncultured Lactococcus sp. TaxID=167973 RepID=A0A060CHD9_9LACT|nr:CAZy families GH5 protein [uncultured Lactococcus sp.]
MQAFGEKIAEINKLVPVVTGEWSLFNSYTAGIDTNGGINPTQQEFGEANKLAKTELQDVYRELWKVQVDSWNRGIGYFFWTYKLNIDTINEPAWYGWDSWAVSRAIDKGWVKKEDI